MWQIGNSRGGGEQSAVGPLLAGAALLCALPSPHAFTHANHPQGALSASTSLGWPSCLHPCEYLVSRARPVLQKR